MEMYLPEQPYNQNGVFPPQEPAAAQEPDTATAEPLQLQPDAYWSVQQPPSVLGQPYVEGPRGTEFQLPRPDLGIPHGVHQGPAPSPTVQAPPTTAKGARSAAGPPRSVRGARETTTRGSAVPSTTSTRGRFLLLSIGVVASAVVAGVLVGGSLSYMLKIQEPGEHRESPDGDALPLPDQDISFNDYPPTTMAEMTTTVTAATSASTAQTSTNVTDAEETTSLSTARGATTSED